MAPVAAAGGGEGAGSEQAIAAAEIGAIAVPPCQWQPVDHSTSRSSNLRDHGTARVCSQPQQGMQQPRKPHRRYLRSRRETGLHRLALLTSLPSSRSNEKPVAATARTAVSYSSEAVFYNMETELFPVVVAKSCVQHLIRAMAKCHIAYTL